MGNTLRIKFATCFALFLLSGCSLFDDAVENCEGPQEYQESVTIPPLLVPSYLKNIQNKSIFNIPNAQVSNAVAEEGFVMPMASNKSPSIVEQSNQMGNIDGDELSELLQLIDKTISNRQAEGQFEPIYENVTSDYESNTSLKPCLDGPPKYFSERISPRTMPNQAYTQPLEASETSEAEKSRRQKRREKRQQKTEKKPQEGTEEDVSLKDSEEPVEGNKVAVIFKSITSVMTNIYTGGRVAGASLSGGKSITPPKPTRPDDGEIIDQTNEGEEADLANRIRNLAVLDPALNDEQRVFIQNMSDKQILEMVGAITQQAKDQDTDQKAISDTKKINNKVSTTAEDDWFTRVKDQWNEGKSQRENRREARQKRRAEQQSQDD